MVSETWNGRFYESDPRFWPIARAASRFAEYLDFPPPEALSTAEVRFVTATKPRRTRRERPPPEAGYDARAAGGAVPTRARSWHDFLNALVWATFPASKRRLHGLQAEAIARALARGAGALPNARSREQDALALLDEGGVLLLSDGRASTPLGFGHALYEGLVRGGPAATASCLCFELSSLPDRADAPGVADRLLAERLSHPFGPEALSRLSF
jgi:hypothetical protein